MILRAGLLLSALCGSLSITGARPSNDRMINVQGAVSLPGQVLCDAETFGFGPWVDAHAQMHSVQNMPCGWSCRFPATFVCRRVAYDTGMLGGERRWAPHIHVAGACPFGCGPSADPLKHVVELCRQKTRKLARRGYRAIPSARNSA